MKIIRKLGRSIEELGARPGEQSLVRTEGTLEGVDSVEAVIAAINAWFTMAFGRDAPRAERTGSNRVSAECAWLKLLVRPTMQLGDGTLAFTIGHLTGDEAMVRRIDVLLQLVTIASALGRTKLKFECAWLDEADAARAIGAEETGDGEFVIETYQAVNALTAQLGDPAIDLRFPTLGSSSLEGYLS